MINMALYNFALSKIAFNMQNLIHENKDPIIEI